MPDSAATATLAGGGERAVTPPAVVDAARAGDEVAWREVFDLQYPRLYRFFRSRVPNHHQAEDLASSTLLQAFRSIAAFHWRGRPFEAWLFGVARHELASFYRAQPPASAELAVLPRKVVHRREAGTAPPTPPCGRR